MMFYSIQDTFADFQGLVNLKQVVKTIEGSRTVVLTDGTNFKLSKEGFDKLTDALKKLS